MATESETRTPAQLFALGFGVIYLIVGLAGWIASGLGDFTSSDESEKLIVFGVNPLHNIVHLVIGALWIAGSRTPSGAKTMNNALGVVYLLVGFLGLFGILDFLNNNPADSLLHLVSGGLSVFFGFMGGGARSRTA